MNLEQILKQAELAEEQWKDSPVIGAQTDALIHAAELLKNVVVLPKGSEAAIGDLVLIEFECDIRGDDTAAVNFEDVASHWEGSKILKIIQRAGKPVIEV